MRKLKDLALHLPLAGLDRSSSSSPSSSPRHRPASPSNPSPSSPSTDESHVSSATSSSGSPISASSIVHFDRKRNLSPLHQACKQGDLPLIHRLLLSAISPSSASEDDVGEPASGDFSGWLPVHLLLSSRALSPLAAHPPELPLLPLLSALLHSPTKGSLINVKNGQGMTPLHLAISRGCAPYIVRHLLALGADPTITVKGKSCVQLAQNEETVKLLLESRAPSASGPVLTKASSRLDIRRSMDLPTVTTTASFASSPSSSSADTSSTSSASLPGKAPGGSRVVLSPREGVDMEDASCAPPPSITTSLSSSPPRSSPLTSPRDNSSSAGSGGGGGGSGVRRKSSTIKKRNSTLTKHRSRPPSPPAVVPESVEDAQEKARAAALQEQQRWLAEQREWARMGREIAQRAEEERTIYLMLCLLCALLAVIGGHLCGYYMGRLEADRYHDRQQQHIASLLNSTLPSSFFSSFFSFFSTSSAPPLVIAAGVDVAQTQTLLRLSLSMGGGMVAFTGLVGLCHFARKMLP